MRPQSPCWKASKCTCVSGPHLQHPAGLLSASRFAKYLYLEKFRIFTLQYILIQKHKVCTWVVISVVYSFSHLSNVLMMN